MPLIKIPFKPGFNKQMTKTTAEYQWTDGDFVRFRYGEPEKIGGWTQPIVNTLPGVARGIHNWVALDGNKYIAIGTTKGLFLYYEGAFYDISPLGTALTSCTITTTNGSATVTINKTGHELKVGEYVVFSSVTLPGSGTGFATGDFTTNPFEVISVPSANTFTITMSSNESGAGITAAGSATVTPYEEIGPLIQTQGFGWGTGTWSGSQNWGDPSSSDDTVLEPGNWSLDNYGEILIATVRNGRTFEWNPQLQTL